ncbi:MAG: lipopolysaccharide assembly protein LapB [Burkholderiaceae bacterium]|nr:MAG: lipopolysaccharide assembly protein LapB [Burkholderiaceae bacterium]
MEFEYWWLITIPLIFGMGWLAARLDLRQLLHESRELPRSYFKGLNFLVNEQSDQAIDAFIEVVRLDPETIELHFALGNLFRKRGETDRAIRMHLNLYQRSDLEPAQREHALYELGQDYMKAGLLDRAEQSFSALNDSRHARDAQLALLEIYQREHDWNKAIAAAQQLQHTHGINQAGLLAHFYCEQAQEALQRQQWENAEALLTQALSVCPHHVRASMLQGELKQQQGQTRAAAEIWSTLAHQHPEFLPLIARRYYAAMQAQGRAAEAETRLRAYLEKRPSHDILLTLFDTAQEAHGAAAALTLLQQELRRAPTLQAFNRLLGMQLENATGDERAMLESIKHLIHRHARQMERYTCQACGFKAREFYWQCPGCAHWDSYAPQRQEETE